MSIIGDPILVGSGSRGLNVVTTAEVPAGITENQILCITEITPSSIIADTEAPVSPAAGDIWIETGSGGEPVSVGCAANRVNVRPVMVRQYGEAGWTPIEAYQARNGEWAGIPFVATEMGVRHAIQEESPLLERLGASVGLTAASGAGAAPQASDFDTMPIYKEIKRCNLGADGTVAAWEGEEGFSTTAADVMVYIPKFWYKRVHDGVHDEWWIADGWVEGYAVHPAFARSAPYDDLEGIFVSAYEASAGYASVSGQAPLTQITRSTARAGIRGKGTNWHQIDAASTMAVNLLIYVEYASLNLQEAIAPGCSGSLTIINTGSTDGMAGHTGCPEGTAAEVGMKWRGIENWWGNAWTWVDGINVNERAYYYCIDPNSFADGADANYTAAGFSVGSVGYIKEVGYSSDCPWLLLPTTTGGTETTYFCDQANSNAGWRVTRFGGGFSGGPYCGPACWDMYNNATTSYAFIACRLLYLKERR